MIRLKAEWATNPVLYGWGQFERSVWWRNFLDDFHKHDKGLTDYIRDRQNHELSRWGAIRVQVRFETFLVFKSNEDSMAFLLRWS